MDPVTMAKILDIYFDLVSNVLKKLNFRFDNSGISIKFRGASSIDE
jgi:hypothetical protein